jgi:hypothetical protein
MNKTDREFLSIVAQLFAAYPTADRGADDSTMIVWARQLSDLDPVLLRRAVENLTDTEPYLPPIAKVRSEFERISRGDLQIRCGFCHQLISDFERADEKATYYDDSGWRHYHCPAP